MTFDGEEFLRELIARHSNWGRWGAEDQLGTLNLVGAEEIRAAVATVTEGRPISCTLPLDPRGPQHSPLRPNPRNIMVATGTDHVAGAQDMLPAGLGPAHGFGRSDDVMIVPNQAGTAWDALSHVFWEGRMYNDRSAALVSSMGAAKNGIEHAAGRMVMRGVVLDVARHMGVAALPPGFAIESDLLLATAKSQGVQVLRGDALLIRTGFLESRRGDWGDYVLGPAPGLSIHTIPWIHSTDVAAIATDTWGVEVRPSQLGVFQPFHIVAVVHMGLALGEIFDFEELAAACAELGRFTCLFVAPTLPITGASGSPAGAIAIL
jgi:kynurenine formamidase